MSHWIPLPEQWDFLQLGAQTVYSDFSGRQGSLLIFKWCYGWPHYCKPLVHSSVSGGESSAFLLLHNCTQDFFQRIFPPHSSPSVHPLSCFVEITKSIINGPCFLGWHWVLFLIPWDLDMEINQVALSLWFSRIWKCPHVLPESFLHFLLFFSVWSFL